MAFGFKSEYAVVYCSLQVLNFIASSWNSMVPLLPLTAPERLLVSVRKYQYEQLRKIDFHKVGIFDVVAQCFLRNVLARLCLARIG